MKVLILMILLIPITSFAAPDWQDATLIKIETGRGHTPLFHDVEVTSYSFKLTDGTVLVADTHRRSIEGVEVGKTVAIPSHQGRRPTSLLDCEPRIVACASAHVGYNPAGGRIEALPAVPVPVIDPPRRETAPRDATDRPDIVGCSCCEHSPKSKSRRPPGRNAPRTRLPFWRRSRRRLCA